MPLAKVPPNLSEPDLQAAFKSIRGRMSGVEDGVFVNPLDGHERICDCAMCSDVRDAAIRQFEQLMEHQCLFYVIQVAAAMEALAKTALLRWVSNTPDMDVMTHPGIVFEYEEVHVDMLRYMAHSDTMEVTWRKVQDSINKQIAARR